MKIHNKPIGECMEVFPVFRGTDTIYFVIRPVEDYSEFERLVPDPIPTRLARRPGGIKVPDVKRDADYLAAVALKNQLRWSYTVIKSLETTEGLTWDTIKMDNPDTWIGVAVELEQAGLSDRESASLFEIILSINGLNAERVEAARENFYRMLQEQSLSESPQKVEAKSTPSGEPASKSESDHPA